MKNRILTFIIGILCGAIITTIGFMFYIKGFQSQIMQPENEDMFKPGEMREPQIGQIGQPPEKPNGEMQINPQDSIQNHYRK